ncbi:plasmid replication, integration and excision activator [Nocardioides sp. InS609-2]|uniref:plasmid replication, integration and excision activator n=1 Tax=Nocardioides sp. InS609-2 TaxID=2760705 RepID=UPI0020BE3AC8|nr:plasmid replication, integration and excision activator [Nocardioides sp. InS609-2]
MAMPRKIKVEFGEVFPFGVYAVSEVAPVRDFDRSTKDKPVHAVDEETGLLVWAVDVMDADPETRKTQRQVTVKLLAKVQPVLPDNKTGLPFTPVEFEGLTATPYIAENGNRSNLAWSFRASGVHAPKGRAERAA